MRPVAEATAEVVCRGAPALQSDRRAHEEVIGRNVDRALRAVGCPERFLQTACCATVVLASPKNKRKRLAKVMWEADMVKNIGHMPGGHVPWEKVAETTREDWLNIADAALAELDKIRRIYGE